MDSCHQIMSLPYSNKLIYIPWNIFTSYGLYHGQEIVCIFWNPHLLDSSSYDFDFFYRGKNMGSQMWILREEEFIYIIYSYVFGLYFVSLTVATRKKKSNPMWRRMEGEVIYSCIYYSYIFHLSFFLLIYRVDKTWKTISEICIFMVEMLYIFIFKVMYLA